MGQRRLPPGAQRPEHDEHEQWSEWIEGSFDPDAFDLAATDAALDTFAWGAGPFRSVCWF